MNKAYAVPLHELLAGVPRDTRLEITDPDGYGTRFIPVGRYCHEAAEALRAALAQPEPEPVAFVVYDSESNDIVWAEAGMHLKQNTPLYTVPPQREWQGLTDEEIIRLRHLYDPTAHWSLDMFARVIEAKLKEKNA